MASEARYFSYLNTAAAIIEQYKGHPPFAIFLKQWLAQSKKYGSRDRRQIAQCCYSYYRLGKALSHLPVQERIKAALYCMPEPWVEFLGAIEPGWSALPTQPPEARLAQMGIHAHEIFGINAPLSHGLMEGKLGLTMLYQPPVYLRVRPGAYKQVQKALERSGLPHLWQGENRVQLPAATQLPADFPLGKAAIVQDANSQETGICLQPYLAQLPPLATCWDCCAASGGKSIMLHDILGLKNWYVSDIRPSILHNLKQRFQQAGLLAKEALVADVSEGIPKGYTSFFDLVVADVPCTGSGTWARTPEQLCYFEEANLTKFASRQKAIVNNAWKAVKPGGYLAYITCSVFGQENEEVVDTLRQQPHARLLFERVLDGTSIQADTMFVALLQRLPHCR
ncbi:MAG TPA: Fmu (Sun) domain-containing protein [Phnomibacter sp.]|nr:Fmu (Sun) domain-containing protein [Phnomibacter sp.]